MLFTRHEIQACSVKHDVHKHMIMRRERSRTLHANSPAADAFDDRKGGISKEMKTKC